jgi:hypothetical protein
MGSITGVLLKTPGSSLPTHPKILGSTQDPFHSHFLYYLPKKIGLCRAHGAYPPNLVPKLKRSLSITLIAKFWGKCIQKKRRFPEIAYPNIQMSTKEIELGQVQQKSLWFLEP